MQFYEKGPFRLWDSSKAQNDTDISVPQPYHVKKCAVKAVYHCSFDISNFGWENWYV